MPSSQMSMWQSLVWPRSSASRCRAQLRMEGAPSPLISLGDAPTWWSLMRQHHQHVSRCTSPRYVYGQPVRQGVQEAAALASHCCLLSGNSLGRLSQQPCLALDAGAACLLCELEMGAACCVALLEACHQTASCRSISPSGAPRQSSCLGCWRAADVSSTCQSRASRSLCLLSG